MDQFANGNTAERKPPIDWMLWAALFFSVAIYVVVALVVRANGAVQTGAPLPMLRVALVMVGLSVTGVILMAPRLFAATLPFTTFNILRCALAESVAVFGLVLAMLGELPSVFSLFFVWSAGLFLLMAPTNTARLRFESRKPTA